MTGTYQGTCWGAGAGDSRQIIYEAGIEVALNIYISGACHAKCSDGRGGIAASSTSDNSVTARDLR